MKKYPFTAGNIAISSAGGMPRDSPSGIKARTVAAWLYSKIDRMNSAMANSQGALVTKC
ncbi:Uncharacterised protein [Streptococcus pneumoniae]|nr:Uncharacterised protein [Streptococcus pneumoniae]